MPEIPAFPLYISREAGQAIARDRVKVKRWPALWPACLGRDVWMLVLVWMSRAKQVCRYAIMRSGAERVACLPDWVVMIWYRAECIACPPAVPLLCCCCLPASCLPACQTRPPVLSLALARPARRPGAPAALPPSSLISYFGGSCLRFLFCCFFMFGEVAPGVWVFCLPGPGPPGVHDLSCWYFLNLLEKRIWILLSVLLYE